MHKRDFKILDCTLRDGGYHTDWSFDRSLIQNLVGALDNNGVDIIELGYKSPAKGGPYRKCNDGFISSVVDFNVRSKLAFMIDVKDYIFGNEVDKGLLYDIIKPASIFSVCRIASKNDEIEYLPELITIIKNLGYEVICNLMAISRVSDSQMRSFIDTVKGSGVLSVYVADSYGALYPSDVASMFDKYDIDGIHTHDNMGLAFANCINAIDGGAKYIDGTLTGMGRGVGNVSTEQLLTYRGDKINNTLLDCIRSFLDMKIKCGWGTNVLYHQAGMHHIHPLYMQDLNKSNLSSSQLINAIYQLRGCDKYDKEKLSHLKEQRAVVVIPARYKSSRFPGKPLAKINGKEMVLHVAEKARDSVGFNNVYIATENEEISKVVRSAGYHVIITSDTCLTGTDRVAEAAREINADIIVNVQGDEPMIDPIDISRAIDLKKKFPDHVINCMSRFHKDENVSDKKIPKIVCDLENNLLYCSRNVLPGTFGNCEIDSKKQVCIYAFSKSQLEMFRDTKKTPLEKYEDIEIIRCLEKGIKVKMMTVDKVSYAVDYQSDIEIVERYM